MTMFCTKHSDHNVVTAALDVLQQLLQSRIEGLLNILLSPNGILPTVTNATAGIASEYFAHFIFYQALLGIRKQALDRSPT